MIKQCNEKFKEKKHCSTPHLTEDEIKAAFVRAANKLVADRNLVLKELQEIQRTLTGTDELEAEQKQLVEKVTVYSRDRIVFTMTSGMEIEV